MMVTLSGRSTSELFGVIRPAPSDLSRETESSDLQEDRVLCTPRDHAADPTRRIRAHRVGYINSIRLIEPRICRRNGVHAPHGLGEFETAGSGVRCYSWVWLAER